MAGAAGRVKARAGRGTLVRQFAKFCLVGTSNTAISFVAYALLIRAGVVYWLAGPIAFALGAANGYILNRRWTFASPDSTAARVRYLIVQLAGLGLTTLLLWLFVSSGALGRIAAYAVTVPTVTVATFLANRAWVFGWSSARLEQPADVA